MSSFPDCRNDDIYNEDFLDNSRKEYLKGMDNAIEMIINLFERNLDMYEEELTEVLEEGEKLKEDEVFATRSDLCSIIEENKMLLSAIISHYYEMERDEIVTALIEGMDEEEYKRIRKDVLKKNAQSENPKEYYNTIKYMFTHKKEFRKE